MYKILTFCCTILVHTFLFGQGDSNSNRIFAETGFTNIVLKNRTFSPLKFSGLVPDATFGYHQDRKHKTRWGTNLSVQYGTINYRDQLYESEYIAARLNIYYLKKFRSSANSNIFAGGQLNSVVNILNYNGFSSGSWFTGQELAACIQFQKNFSEKHSLVGSFSYPVFGLISTPGYAGIDEFVVVNSENIPKILFSRPNAYTLNKFINPRIQLIYFYWLPKIGFSVSCNYEYRQINAVRRQFQHQSGIKAGFHLKINKKNEN